MVSSLETLRALTVTLVERDAEAKRWERRFRALLDVIPIGAMLTKNRQIIYANRSMEELTGYAVVELIGKSTRLLYFNENEWIEVGKDILNMLEVSEMVMIKRKDGKPVQCLQQTKMIDIEDLEMVVLLNTEE